MKKKILIVLALLALTAIIFFIFNERADAPQNDNAPREETAEIEPEAEISQPEEASFDTQQFSINEPGSIWWIVSRDRPLPRGYAPPDLSVANVSLRLAASAEQMQFSSQAIPAVEAMFAAASNDGVNLVFGSGYRSEALQAQFYNSYVARDGQAAADRYSARPGTSEHQTGLAFDVTSRSGACHLEICFEDLPEGQWVRDNAHKYGFIIRYLDGKEDITGYQYEPWHLRYVGTELAAELQQSGQTMEEFFGLTN